MPTSNASTPAPCLPTEIVSHIVREVRETSNTWANDLQSLCLVRKEYLNPCQEALFQHITIGPLPDIVEGATPQGPNRATRFAEVIARAPDLGKYVKSLHYKLCGRIDDRTEAATALILLTQLHTLHIEYCSFRSVWLDWSENIPEYDRIARERYHMLLKAFGMLLVRPSLKELVLKNICLPSDMALKARTVETLWLDGSAQCM